MNAADRPDRPDRPDGPDGPDGPGRHDDDDNANANANANANDEETTAMNTPFATPGEYTTPDHTASDYTAADDTTADDATQPDQPLDDPLPYGAGFAPTQQFGYGVAPEPARYTPTAVATRQRSGSPVLAVAGLLSLGVAVWAILGAPMITTTVMLAGALVIAVLVGLVMVVRR